MKVLILEGYPQGRHDKKYERELAKVWLDKQRRVHVDALAPEFQQFADTTQSMIDERLANPKTPIYTMVAKTTAAEDGSVWYSDCLYFSSPEKDDFLDVLIGDTILFATGKAIAGYEVATGASKVINA